MNARLPAVCLLLLTVAAAGALAQSSVNPDVSVIGEINVYGHNDKSQPEESEKLSLADPSMELVVSDYVNPYVRADAVVAWHGETKAEIEEMYATVLRGLPLDMNLRLGKYLLEFGRLNPVHPHAWSFIKRPLPHEAFFGDHGLADVTVRTSFLLPTGDAYTELMAGLLKGDALIGEHDHEHEDAGAGVDHEETVIERPDLGFFGRLTTSLAVSDAAELAFGGSVVNAVYGAAHSEEDSVVVETEDPEQLRAWAAGVDVKYKHRPSRYTTLLIEAEGLVRSEEQHEGDRLNSYGGYGYVDYRFRQKYNVGGIFEYLSQKHTYEHEIVTHDTWRAGLFVGFAPIEETSLVRLAGHWTEPDEGDGFWNLNLQFVFSLGPHQPHNF